MVLVETSTTAHSGREWFRTHTLKKNVIFSTRTLGFIFTANKSDRQQIDKIEGKIENQLYCCKILKEKKYILKLWKMMVTRLGCQTSSSCSSHSSSSTASRALQWVDLSDPRFQQNVCAIPYLVPKDICWSNGVQHPFSSTHTHICIYKNTYIYIYIHI